MTVMIKSNEQRRIYGPPMWRDKARGVTLSDACPGGNSTHLTGRSLSTFMISTESIAFIMCGSYVHCERYANPSELATA